MNIAGTIVNRSFRRFTTDDLKKTPENRINGFFLQPCCKFNQNILCSKNVLEIYKIPYFCNFKVIRCSNKL